MRRRFLLHALLPAIPALVLPAVTLPILARAETPAEAASRQLRRDIQEDRATEAARPEGPAPVPQTPAARALEVDRRSLQPDVGRPEQLGMPPSAAERGTTGAGNPQR